VNPSVQTLPRRAYSFSLDADVSAPVGRQGERTVRMIPGGQTPWGVFRAVSAAIGSGLTRLADRIVALVSPERSDYVRQRVFSAFANTDRALSQTLTALTTNQDQSREGLCALLLAGITQEAGQVPGLAGSESDRAAAVVAARLPRLLKDRSLEDLRSIQAALGPEDLTRKSPGDPVRAVFQAALTHAMTEKADERWNAQVTTAKDLILQKIQPRAQQIQNYLERGTKRASGRSSDDKGHAPAGEPGLPRREDTRQVLHALYQALESQLAKDGQPPDSKKVWALLLQACSSIPDELPDSERGSAATLTAVYELFSDIPTTELKFLHMLAQEKSDASPGGDGFSSVANALWGQIGLRSENLEDSFKKAFNSLVHQPAATTDGLASQVLSVCAGLDAMRLHAQVHDLTVLDPASDLDPTLPAVLHEHFLDADLSGVSTDVLLRLSGALSRHGGPIAGVQKEIAWRFAEHRAVPIKAFQEPHRALLRQLAANGGRPEPPDASAFAQLMSACRQVTRLREELVAQCAELGAPVPLASRQAFFADLIHQALKDLSDEDTEALKSFLTRPQIAALKAGLHGVAATPLEGASAGASGINPSHREARLMAEYLTALQEALDVEPLSPHQGSDQDSMDLRKVIGDALGARQAVEFAQSGTLPDQAMRHFLETLRKIQQLPFQPGTRTQLLSREMETDLGRAVFLAPDAGLPKPGAPVPLFSRSTTGDPYATAAKRLSDLAGGDTLAVQHLSRFAYQGPLKAMAMMPLLRDSPVRLGSSPGKPVEMRAGDQSTEFQIEPHPEGGWSLGLEWLYGSSSAMELEDVLGFPTLALGAESVALDPKRSFMRMSAVLRIHPNGVATVSEPPSYAFSLQLAETPSAQA